MNKTYSLASVKNTWELTYTEDNTTFLGKALVGVISVAAAPIISVVGVFILYNSGKKWIKSHLRTQTALFQQNLIAKDDDVALKQLAAARVKRCDNRIEKLKAAIKKTLTQDFWDSAKLEVGVPQKRGFYDYLAKKLPESYWNDFSWDDFLKKDFDESKLAQMDKAPFYAIERLRIRLVITLKQKEELSNRPEAIKEVIELKHLKNVIKIEEAKKWLLHGLFCLIPTGLFWDFAFFISDDKQRFEAIKFGTDNVLETHNKLVKKGYLTPFLTHTITDDQQRFEIGVAKARETYNKLLKNELAKMGYLTPHSNNN